MIREASAEPFVVGVTATLRRPQELRRLIKSLPTAGSALQALIVIDNADDPEIRQVVAESPIRIEYHAPGTNLGCGGGLNAGGKLAMELFGEKLTHLWILDDDTVMGIGTLDILLETMCREDADAAHPLVIDEVGNLGWYPGLTDRQKFQVIRQQQTPEQFVTRCGDTPIAFNWCQGIALLVSRRALDRCGFHRTDYWVRGEDLEFSLRITHRFRGLYIPRARVHHLPPPPVVGVPPAAEYAKHRAMLQNIAYTSLRLRHGWPIARTIPGNWLRFFRTWGFRTGVLVDGWRVLWRGAVLGWPAGHPDSHFSSL